MERTQLATTTLGGTGLELTRIGFGAWAIGGEWTFGWGPQDDDESIAAISHAIELGVNWIDTAAGYGFGHSEEIVGRALEGMSERPLVFTKCGILEGPERSVVRSITRDSVLAEAEASLARLRVDAIDLYQIHWPIPDAEVEEGWAAMVELREQGLVRHIGVSNFNVEQLRRAGAIAPVETLQPPYSLVAREIEAEILPYCASAGIGVLAYSPMGSGLLTGKMTRERIAGLAAGDWRKGSTRFNEPELSVNLAIADRVGTVAERLGVAPGAVAIAWALHNPAVDVAIVGVRAPGQIDELLVGAGLELSAGDVAELEAR
jgi:aryl-alcohol dehydrogenase-like predicted oxidoreductase